MSRTDNQQVGWAVGLSAWIEGWAHTDLRTWVYVNGTVGATIDDIRHAATAAFQERFLDDRPWQVRAVVMPIHASHPMTILEAGYDPDNTD